jgi:hypothetical protein
MISDEVEASDAEQVAELDLLPKISCWQQVLKLLALTACFLMELDYQALEPSSSDDS